MDKLLNISAYIIIEVPALAHISNTALCLVARWNIILCTILSRYMSVLLCSTRTGVFCSTAKLWQLYSFILSSYSNYC